MRILLVRSTGRSAWTPRSTGPISTRRTSCAPQTALSSYKNLSQEPSAYSIGPSRDGLSTRIHHLVDGRVLALIVLVGAGQIGVASMFLILIGHLRVARRGPGRACPGPDRVRGDKAYSSRAIRIVPMQARHRRRHPGAFGAERPPQAQGIPAEGARSVTTLRTTRAATSSSEILTRARSRALDTRDDKARADLPRWGSPACHQPMAQTVRRHSPAAARIRLEEPVALTEGSVVAVPPA